MIYDYARVSTDGQSVDAQVRQLSKAGCKKVFREVASGAKTERAQLRRVLDRLAAGDVVMVTRLDRLAPRRSRRNPRRSPSLSQMISAASAFQASAQENMNSRAHRTCHKQHSHISFVRRLRFTSVILAPQNSQLLNA